MSDVKITKEQWDDATSSFVVVVLWTANPWAKRQTPVVKVEGDYPTYSKARSVKKRIDKDDDPSHSPERRSVYVARKFDATKLDPFNTYYYE